MNNSKIITIKKSFLALLFYFIIGGFLSLLSGIIGLDSNYAVYGSVIITYLLLLAYFQKQTQYKITEYVNKESIHPLLIIIFCVSIYCYSLFADLSFIMMNRISPMSNKIYSFMYIREINFGIITLGIMLTISKELLFKGVILFGLTKKHTRILSIIIVSSILSIIDLSPWNFIAFFIYNLITCWITLKTKSILYTSFGSLLIQIRFMYYVSYGNILTYEDFLSYTHNDLNTFSGHINGSLFFIIGIILFNFLLNKITKDRLNYD